MAILFPPPTTPYEPVTGQPIIDTNRITIWRHPDNENVFVITPKSSELLDADVCAEIKSTVTKFITDQKKPGVKRKLILDMKGAMHVGSFYLEDFITMNNQLKTQGDETLALAGVDPTIMEVFVITRLSKIFDFADNIKAAAVVSKAR